MAPVDVGVTYSKVKITGALNVRMVSAHYLENFFSQSLHISPNDVWSRLSILILGSLVQRSKLQALNVRMVSAHYSENFLSQSLHISLID
jgi:hypothetical protein